MSFNPDTLDIVVMGVTIAATVLGAVALVLNSKKAPTDPVMEVKLTHVTETMEGLKEDLIQMREEFMSASHDLTQEFRTLTKDFSEMRLSQNGLHVRMEGLVKVIDEMPAKFARIAKALGK